MDQSFLHLLFCLIQLLLGLRKHAHADSVICLFSPHRNITLLLTVQYSSLAAVLYKVAIVTLKILKFGIARSRILSHTVTSRPEKTRTCRLCYLFSPHRNITVLLTVQYSSLAAVLYKVAIVTLKIL